VSATLPVSVVVPTAGRAELVRQCLESLAKCDPRAAEVVIVDQSRGREIADIVSGFADIGARRVPCEERGVSAGTNLGIHEAANEIVLVTHDDCTVDPAWSIRLGRLPHGG
jgi:glycosyltransferase involved in cell wall biosynthesis